MRISKWIVCAIVLAGGLALAGCGDEPKKPAAPAKSTTQKAGDVDTRTPAVDAKAEAQGLIDKLSAAIAAKKLTEADDLLKKLLAMKDSLPADQQKKVGELETALKAAKAAGDAKVPGDIPLPR